MEKIKIAILASGKGTNALNCAEYFSKHPFIYISVIISNNPTAEVLESIKKYNIPTKVITNAAFVYGEEVLDLLNHFEVDAIVLAGFLRKLPISIIQKYPDLIINLHPSLLPKHGGKGMYGTNVHESVIESKDKKSGITMHLVNEQYDEGAIIAQYSLFVMDNDTPHTLQKRIQSLEHEYFPKVIAAYLQTIFNL